ncbi:MAG: cupin domain-containing protein [Bradymonadaceae bacterium]
MSRGKIIITLAIAMIATLAVGLFGGVVIADEIRAEKPLVVHTNRAPQKVGEDGQVRAIMLTQGQNAYMGKIVLEPNAQLSDRRHNAEEYLYIIEGSSVITIDGQSYILGPRMAVYIPTDAEVGFVNGNERFVAVQVYAGPGPAEAYDGWQTRDSTQPWPRRSRPRTRTRQSMR